MTKFWNEYHRPTSLDEALALLAHYDGRARVVAGGTDLLLDFQADYDAGERPHVDALIDVTRMAGADTLAERDGYIVIGCGVTHTRIVHSPLIQTHATALAEACAVVGGPQVRNVATLVGNIAHALPAADGTIALIALGAEALVNEPMGQSQPTPRVSKEPNAWRPLASLFRGPGVSAVDPTRQVIMAVRFRPTGEREASAFSRVMRPQGVALPILGMAVRMAAEPTHPSTPSSTPLSLCSESAQDALDALRIGDISISAGPVAPVPFRASKTEEFLRGKAVNAQTLDQAAQILLREVAPRTSAHRATREYRLELLPMLLRKTVGAALDRIRCDA